MIRKILALMMAGGLLAGAPAHAQAPGPDYPARPIRVIVPLAAGGGTDVLARVIATHLRPRLGQPVTVENRTGAAGNIGAEAVFRAPPDGYTLLFTQPGPLAVNKALYSKLGFDPDQFVPVALVSQQDILLAVNPKVPARTLQELITYARANPGVLNYGSSGSGSAPHLAAELFKSMTGIRMTHIPYKGAGESMNATLGGQVDLTFFAFSTALPHARANKLRALAVGGTRRNAQLPDVPAIAEALPGYSAASWTALVAPPGTPPAIVHKLAQAVAEVVREPEVHQRIIDAGDEVLTGTPAQMAEFLQQERKRWAEVVRTAGIQVE